MIFDLLLRKKRPSSSTSYPLAEGVSLEWKKPIATPLKVTRTTRDGKKVHRFETRSEMGWVRLHLSIPAQDAAILAARIILQINSDTTRPTLKPFIVSSHIDGNLRREFASAPSQRLTVEAGQWVDISGAYLQAGLPEGQRLDVVIDLPQDAEILLADTQHDWFEASLSQEEHTRLHTEGPRPFSAFSPRPVYELNDWLKAPAVYAQSITIDKDGFEGYMLTRANNLYWYSTSANDKQDITLDKPHTTDGVIIENARFEVALSPSLPNHACVYVTSAQHQQTAQCSAALSSVELGGKSVKSKWNRDRQNNVILLWAPISTSGLTVQLEQTARILQRLKLDFQISYHMKPTVEHPLSEHWVHPRDIDQPRAAIFFERFVEFDRGFDATFKVFYLNLDWLAPTTLTLAKTHANLVLCPTPYLFDELSETFENSKVIHLPWPAKFEPVYAAETKATSEKLRVLYIGNDYDQHSRKHPQAVVEAIEALKRKDIVFDLKFRSPLPGHIRQRLTNNPRVDKVIDWPTEHDVVEELYAEADINLIPNACEGNGLSILESWASGTVPAVLDGHPMKDVTKPDNSYRIACSQIGEKERAPLYQTTGQQIHDFLKTLTLEDLYQKKQVVREMESELLGRQDALERTIRNISMMAGMRTRDIRLSLENAHLPMSQDAQTSPRDGQRVKSLLFDRPTHLEFRKSPQLVDVLLTTSQRAWCLRDSLPQLITAMQKSPYQHRLFLSVDNLDPETLAVIETHRDAIDHLVWANARHGLPYHWNNLNDMRRNVSYRDERKADYVCYIQDDCYIKNPGQYFEAMVGVAQAAMPGYLGYVSGYYTEVHPGFADFEWEGHSVVASDSIDGKNFMATPELLASVGPLSWWFKDGSRRGNPGPVRGSHFDLWQWKESPNCLQQQRRISLILPELCSHIAETAKDSTWNNDTTDSSVQKRVSENRVYTTRN